MYTQQRHVSITSVNYDKLCSRQKSDLLAPWRGVVRPLRPPPLGYGSAGDGVDDDVCLLCMQRELSSDDAVVARRDVVRESDDVEDVSRESYDGVAYLGSIDDDDDYLSERRDRESPVCGTMEELEIDSGRGTSVDTARNSCKNRTSAFTDEDTTTLF